MRTREGMAVARRRASFAANSPSSPRNSRRNSAGCTPRATTASPTSPSSSPCPGDGVPHPATRLGIRQDPLITSLPTLRLGTASKVPGLVAAGGQPGQHPSHDVLSEQIGRGERGVGLQCDLVGVGAHRAGPGRRMAVVVRQRDRAVVAAMAGRGACRIMATLGPASSVTSASISSTMTSRPTAVEAASSPSRTCSTKVARWASTRPRAGWRVRRRQRRPASTGRSRQGETSRRSVHPEQSQPACPVWR